MESQNGERVSPEVGPWATLLFRAVADLAAALPDDLPLGHPDSQERVPFYGLDAAEDEESYHLWLRGREERRREERTANRQHVAGLTNPPTIGVIEGRSAAEWNSKAAESGADFLAFLETGDELEPGVIDDLIVVVHEDPSIDVIYTDSDLVGEDGRRVHPFFKPGWSPDQLLSHPYIGRLLVVRRPLFEQVGGFQTEYGPAAEYDLALRVGEQARRVHRLPVVGYHRRTREQLDDQVVVRILEEALRRRGETGSAEPGLCPGTYRVRRAIQGNPRVSVIVPFHNGAEHLRRCLTSLYETAGHENWEVVLVDNQSWDPNTAALLARYESDHRVRILQYPERFNWAAINNFAARTSTADHLLFMNADVQGRSEGWMAALLEHSQRPEVGAVGARLVYPDGRLQHAGVVMGLGGGVAWHAFCYCPGDRSGYLDQAKVIRNCSAVTGACMMVRHDVFRQVGGFAEELPIAYNDVDFCLRVRDHGYWVVYTPFAELIHDESYTRGRLPPDAFAVETMRARWGDQISCDEFFNPNLDLRRPEAVVALGAGGANGR